MGLQSTRVSVLSFVFLIFFFDAIVFICARSFLPVAGAHALSALDRAVPFFLRSFFLAVE